MNKACTDNNIGLMLHAYELNLLSESDKDIFESHLLECEYCYQQIKQFAPLGIVLSSNYHLLASLQETKKSETPKPNNILSFLWPENIPFVFKPAVLSVIILLLSYPAFLGIHEFNSPKVRSIQEIGLVLNRSTEKNNIFKLNYNNETVLSFLVPGNTGNHLSIKLLTEDSTIVYEDNDFSDIDSYGIVRLLISKNLLKKGSYQLIVSSGSNTYQYGFTVEFNDEVNMGSPQE